MPTAMDVEQQQAGLLPRDIEIDASPDAADGECGVDDVLISSSLLQAPVRGREHYSLACLWAEIK